jgi:hypothetical protein
MRRRVTAASPIARGTMKRTRALLGIATGLGLLAVGAPAQAAPPSPPPRPQPFTFDLDVPVDFPLGHCDFPVHILATGKTKTIQIPTGTTIGIAGDATGTVTRTDEQGGSVEYSINGSFINTTDADGNVTTKATGRNLLTDPEAGVVVTSGNFTFTFDKDGNLLEGLSGTGKIIDVCAELA